MKQAWLWLLLLKTELVAGHQNKAKRQIQKSNVFRKENGEKRESKNCWVIVLGRLGTNERVIRTLKVGGSPNVVCNVTRI